MNLTSENQKLFEEFEELWYEAYVDNNYTRSQRLAYVSSKIIEKEDKHEFNPQQLTAVQKDLLTKARILVTVRR